MRGVRVPLPAPPKMQLSEAIVKAGWSKDEEDAISLLFQCLISVNDKPVEAENFDDQLSHGDRLTLWEPNPSPFNAFKVSKKAYFTINDHQSTE